MRVSFLSALACLAAAALACNPKPRSCSLLQTRPRVQTRPSTVCTYSLHILAVCNEQSALSCIAACLSAFPPRALFCHAAGTHAALQRARFPHQSAASAAGRRSSFLFVSHGGQARKARPCAVVVVAVVAEGTQVRFEQRLGAHSLD